jgi:arylsulfatase A-like enzyme
MASWDAEVSRLFTFLESSGLRDRSYIVLTSDHGELFERGDVGHWTRLLFDAIMHVPLMISAPGQKGRRDVHSPTSSIDIVPTLAHLTENPIPSWAEGQLLPEFGGTDDAGRSVFTVDAKNNPSWAPLTRTSLSLTKNAQRLTYYLYPGEYTGYEFYDLAEDPEELNNLYGSSPVAALQMQDELMQRLSEVNAPYEKVPG